MLSNNIWPVLTDFREKIQLFIDSSFTLLTVSFLTSWDVKVVIYDLLLPDPVRKATSSRSSLRYIASPPFISFITSSHCVLGELFHIIGLNYYSLFKVCVHWKETELPVSFRFQGFLSQPYLPPKKTTLHPNSKYFTKWKITCQHQIFHQQVSDPPKLWQSPPSISIIPIIFDNATAKDQLVVL